MKATYCNYLSKVLTTTATTQTLLGLRCFAIRGQKKKEILLRYDFDTFKCVLSLQLLVLV